MAAKKQPPSHERMRDSGKKQYAFWVPLDEAELIERIAVAEKRSIATLFRVATVAYAKKADAKIKKI